MTVKLVADGRKLLIQLHRFREKRFSAAIELSRTLAAMRLVLVLQWFSSWRGSPTWVQLQRYVCGALQLGMAEPRAGSGENDDVGRESASSRNSGKLTNDN
jgi:hypothetical protein